MSETATPTPRTDAVTFKAGNISPTNEVVPASFARELELRLNSFSDIEKRCATMERSLTAVPKGVVGYLNQRGDFVSVAHMKRAKDVNSAAYPEYTIPLGVLRPEEKGVWEALEFAAIQYEKIRDADYRGWSPGMNTESDFVAWAKSRAGLLATECRAALSGRQAATWQGMDVQAVISKYKAKYESGDYPSDRLIGYMEILEDLGVKL